MPSSQDALPFSPVEPITLTLSGGGLRAALFQLGVFAYLAEQDRLKDVREIVSVSGGSILAAHFLKNWREAINSPDGFRRVAAELVLVARSNIRNRIIIPWIWSWILPWLWFKRRQRRSERLRCEYQRIFGTTALGDLATAELPDIAIVATDSIRQERIAFTSSTILRWPLNCDDKGNSQIPSPIVSKGVELSLAVASSSCFPPVFPRFHLTYKDLGITFGEFKEELDLNDGGVVTNLGIEVLVALRAKGWADNTLVVICDAECVLAKRPGNSPLIDVDAGLAAQSAAARKSVKREFAERGILVPFSDREEVGDGLSFRAQTNLFDYRTDLDCPTWNETYALMLHGAMIARQNISTRLTPVECDSLKQTISSVIAKAGGPDDLSPPNHNVLDGCGTRPMRRVYLHATAVILIILALCILILWGIIKSGVIGRIKPSETGGGPMVDIDDFDVPELNKSGLPRLTEADRAQPGYMKTVNRITNRTDRNISLVYSVVPKGKQQQDVLNKIHVKDIPAGIQKMEDPHERFGGPIHLTVRYGGKWYPAKQWTDFGVSPEHDIYIEWDRSVNDFKLTVESVK